MGFNYAISDAANLRLKDNATGNIVLYTPYANKTDCEFSSEQVYAKAKGSDAVRFDYNKKGTLNCEFEVFDLKWISILLGGTWSTGSVNIAAREVLTANSSHTITLSDEPVTGSLAVFALLADNIGHGTEQTAGTPASMPDTYSIADKVITLHATSGAEGNKFVVYYLKDSAATAETIHIKTSEFPVSYEIIGDTMLTRKHDGVSEFMQFKCGNTKPKGQFTLSMAAQTPTNLTANFDLFGDSNDDMMVLTKL